ncbi:MAG: TIGR03086 family metal-binding protein [Mycobacterium sp.]
MLEVAAEPTRRRLLQLLALGEHTVTELASQFPVTRSAVSQHLGVLVEVGLVTARKQGRQRYYRLDEAGMVRLQELVRTFWSDELDNLVTEANTATEGDLAMPFDKSVLVPLEPAAVFALITEPDRLRRWLAVTARVELCTGGEYRWTITPGHVAAGTIIEVDPGNRVVLSWGWEDGDPPPGCSTVSITLTPVDGGTEVRLIHDGLNEEQAARHAEGWNHYLDRLVAAGGRGDAGPDDWADEPQDIDELSSAEATLAVLQRVLRGLDGADLSKQTPCAEFNVAELLDHLMGSITAIGKSAGASPRARDTNAPLESQVADAAEVALEAWRRRGIEGLVSLNSNQVPAILPIHILSLEFLLHAWDFARAVEQQVSVSEPVAEYVHRIAGKVITPESRQYAGFADPVATAPDAGVFDRLIAFSGRQPATA